MGMSAYGVHKMRNLCEVWCERSKHNQIGTINDGIIVSQFGRNFFTFTPWEKRRNLREAAAKLNWRLTNILHQRVEMDNMLHREVTVIHVTD